MIYKVLPKENISYCEIRFSFEKNTSPCRYTNVGTPPPQLIFSPCVDVKMGGCVLHHSGESHGNYSIFKGAQVTVSLLGMLF